MKILNFGAGAVGLGIDSCLIKSGCDVTILARPQTAELLNKEGFKRTGIFDDFIANAGSFRAFGALSDIPRQAFDFIIITVKSYDSQETAAILNKNAHVMDQNTKLILCQNGWGNAEVFTQYFPKEQLYSARVITGFSRPQSNEVVITVHADDIHLGSLFDNPLDCLEPLSISISQGGIPCRVVPDIEKDLWAKLLYNCALNPLGATLGVSYGALAEKEETRAVMENIIKEIYAVMHADGYATHWQTPQEYIKVFYEKLVPATANHKSSTLQALKAGKRIEIDALTGIVLELAREHNIPVPVNQKVYNDIQKVAAENKSRAEKTSKS